MAVLLTWDHPFDLAPRSARIVRGSLIVIPDSTWGCAVDLSSDDPEQAYIVEYLDSVGNPVHTVQPDAIRRMPKLASVCDVTFELVRSDGSPDSNRIIHAADIEGQTPGTMIRYAANYAGKAMIFRRKGVRQYFHLEGAALGLDTIIPDVAEVRFEDLVGSRVLHDRRGWF